ncbi:MAG: chromate transporter [Bacteroidales bacterium]|nr:chromate transporter [Bacteroidales bacterium]
MIFIELFFTFLKIGIFTFGGGLGMVALIQNEVVVKHHWMTLAEFTDIFAISQMTPGPVGINVATYAGYTAVLHAGYSPAWAVVGSLLASVAVILLPALLMVAVLRFLSAHRENRDVRNVMSALSLVVVGIVAAAALVLVGESSFGVVGYNRRFITSVCIFIAVVVLSMMPKKLTTTFGGRQFSLSRPSPIVLIVLSGAVGLLVYGW